MPSATSLNVAQLRQADYEDDLRARDRKIDLLQAQADQLQATINRLMTQGVTAATPATPAASGSSGGGFARIPAHASTHSAGGSDAVSPAAIGAVAVGDAAGGDLGSTYPNPTVVQLRGRALAATAPSAGQAIVWDAGGSTWKPGTVTGGATPIEYIAGCILRWNSTASLTVSTGSLYSVAAAALINVAASFTVTPSTGVGVTGAATIVLGNNTRYFVYLDTATTVVISTTGPTAYSGTAQKDGADRRYIGMFRTDGTANIINTKREGDRVSLRVDTTAAPWQIATATGANTVALVGLVPPGCRMVDIVVNLTGASSAVSIGFGSSDGVTPSSTTGSGVAQASNEFGGPVTHGMFTADLNASQQLLYNAAATAVVIQLQAYYEPR